MVLICIKKMSSCIVEMSCLFKKSKYIYLFYNHVLFFVKTKMALCSWTIIKTVIYIFGEKDLAVSVV